MKLQHAESMTKSDGTLSSVLLKKRDTEIEQRINTQIEQRIEKMKLKGKSPSGG